jgi:hypothetical protein
MNWNQIFGRRFFFKHLILILMMASLSACGGGGGDDDGGNNFSIDVVGGLEGSVKDALTGDLISFAAIFVGDRVDVTGDAGTYTLGDLSIGDRAVTAIRSGYQTFSGTAVVSKGIVNGFDIKMVPSDSTDSVSPSVPQDLALSIDVIPGTPNNQVTLTWSPSTDDVDVIGYQVYRNNALFATTVKTSFVDADLNVCYQVSAFDEAGNESALSGEVCNGTPDITPPVTTITSAPIDPTNATDATFTFSADEASTFECDLDGSGFSSCISPKTYTGLAESPHIFNVRATDLAANTGTAAVHGWVIDITPPVTTIISGPVDPTNAIDATFTFSAN